MTSTSRRKELLDSRGRRARIALGGLLAMMLPVLSSPAQDDGFDEDVEEPVGAVQAFEIPINNFDQWVFGGGNNLQRGRSRIKSQATLRVDAIDQICGLSEQQKAKLQLASRGDMKRFFDDVDVVRQKFLQVRHDRNAFNQIWKDIQPLQLRIKNGLFEQESLLHKVVRRTLNMQQMAKYETAEQERRRFHYEAKVAAVMTMIESGMPLRDEQRQRLLKVILAETQPPKRFGQYDYYVVMYKLSKIPQDKLKPIFAAGQWRVMQKQFAQGRGMEQFLQQNGFLP